MTAEDVAVWIVLAIGGLGFVALSVLQAQPPHGLDVLLAGVVR